MGGRVGYIIVVLTESSLKFGQTIMYRIDQIINTK